MVLIIIIMHMCFDWFGPLAFPFGSDVVSHHRVHTREYLDVSFTM